MVVLRSASIYSIARGRHNGRTVGFRLFYVHFEKTLKNNPFAMKIPRKSLPRCGEVNAVPRNGCVHSFHQIIE